VGAIYAESICILCRHNIACLWPAVSPKFVALLRGGGGVETFETRAGSLPTGWRTLCPRPPGPKASAPDWFQDFYRPVLATVSPSGGTAGLCATQRKGRNLCQDIQAIAGKNLREIGSSSAISAKASINEATISNLRAAACAGMLNQSRSIWRCSISGCVPPGFGWGIRCSPSAT
jgi:hypothetical protein